MMSISGASLMIASTVAGLVIGLVGSLAWVGLLVEGADTGVTGRFQQWVGLSDAATALAADPSGLDFEEFNGSIFFQ